MSRIGFTLTEVVVSLAIVAIAVVGLLRLHSLSLAAADKADKTAQALAIAQNKIAELEAGGVLQAGTQAGSIDRNRTAFHWQVQVCDQPLPQRPASDRGRVRKVVVTVRWDHGAGRRDVTLSTLLADRAPRLSSEF